MRHDTFRRWYIVIRERVVNGSEVYRAYQLGPHQEKPYGEIVWTGTSLKGAVHEERRLNGYIPRIQSVDINELLSDIRMFPPEKKRIDNGERNS